VRKVLRTPLHRDRCAACDPPPAIRRLHGVKSRADRQLLPPSACSVEAPCPHPIACWHRQLEPAALGAAQRTGALCVAEQYRRREQCPVAGADTAAAARTAGVSVLCPLWLRVPGICSTGLLWLRAPTRQQLPALEMHHPSSPFSSLDATQPADALCNTVMLCDTCSTQAAAAQHSQAAQLQTSGHNIPPTQHAAGSDMSPAVAAV